MAAPEPHVSRGLPPQLAGDPRWELVERIAGSRSFQRSARLRDFLLYVSERVLADGITEIREQEIGVAVFGRPPQFDTTQDTIVRVHASQVRKRLEQYFAADGADEPLLVEIPKGNYAPVFLPRHAPQKVPAAEGTAVAPARPVAWMAACAVLALLCAVLLAREGLRTRDEHRYPTLRRFWTMLFSQGRDTRIVLADSNLSALSTNLAVDVPLSDYVNHRWSERIAESKLSPDARHILEWMMRRQYTSIADAGMVRDLMLLPSINTRQAKIVFARENDLRSFQSDNVILLGNRKANPWVELFEKTMDFRFRFYQESHDAVVENHRPQNGERKEYSVSPATAEVEGLGVIALLPNLAGNGLVLLISGNDMPGTEALAQVLTREAPLAELLARIPSRPDGRIAPFEALLKTKKLGAAASGFEVLAAHTR